MVIYTSVIVVCETHFFDAKVLLQSGNVVFSSLVLGLLLVFRNNTAYDRWWEARKLWGQLTNDSRNLAIKLSGLPKPTVAERTEAIDCLRAFALALKGHLRQPGKDRHAPLHLASQLMQTVNRWRQTGLVDNFEWLILDPHLRALMDICGGAERIRNSPLPHSYLAFLRQGIAIYLLCLPWFLVDNLGYWAIPTAVMITYFTVGIELIAEAIEEPFGHDSDDLALGDLCLTIERSLNMIVADMPKQAG